MKSVGKNEWNPTAVSNFWNQLSGTDVLYFSEEVGDMVLDKVDIDRSAELSIADLGGGRGMLFPHVRRLFSKARYTLIDVSEASLRSAKESYSNDGNFAGTVDVSTVLSSNFDTQFDLVVSLEVIEHLQDDELKMYGQQLQKLCKPGGKLLISTPNDEDLEASMVYCPGTDQYFHRMQHVRSWTERSLGDYLADLGFTVEKSITTALIKSKFKRLLSAFKDAIKGRKNNCQLIVVAVKT